MKAQYTVHCTHPTTGKVGCWIFNGPSHKIVGSAISPFFASLVELFDWMKDNGWKILPLKLECEHAPPTNQQVLDGRIVTSTASIRLINRRHEEYHGPIYSWCNCYWFFYMNKPVQAEMTDTGWKEKTDDKP